MLASQGLKMETLVPLRFNPRHFASLQAQTVTGSGTTGTIPVWTGTSKLGNSKILQNGNEVFIGGMVTGYTFSVKGASGIAGYATSASGSGVEGFSTDGTGVSGSSSTNDAVSGTSGSGTGVYGASTSGIGILGGSTSNNGVKGTSPAASACPARAPVARACGV